MSTYQGWFFLEVLKCLPTQIHNSFFFILHTYVIFARKYTIYERISEYWNNVDKFTLFALWRPWIAMDDVHLSWIRQDYILATILFFSADINDAINLHKYCLFNIGEVRTVLGCGLDSHSCQTRITVTNIHQWPGDISGIAPQPPQWTMWHCLHQCVSFRFWFGMVASYQGN